MASGRVRDVPVGPTTPMPRGYTFVRKGNVYVTAHCRRATHAAGRTVYVVTTAGGLGAGAGANTGTNADALGLRCPREIVAQVRAAERATRGARHEATKRRDTTQAAAFRRALLAHYAAVPRDTVPQIVRHAMTKHAGRVARTATLDLATRVRLAVRAHIRHCWTDYEQRLRADAADAADVADVADMEDAAGVAGAKRSHGQRARAQTRRNAARAATAGRVDAIERQWIGPADRGIDDATTHAVGRRKDEANADGGGQAAWVPARTKGTVPEVTRPLRGCDKETAIVIESDEDVEDDGDSVAAYSVGNSYGDWTPEK